jgi:drug/metabolite transporter (DMT)-like permease
MAGPAPLAAFLLLWSSGYIVGAVGVEAAPPLALLLIRFAIASAVAVPLALRVPGWRRAPFARLAAIGLLFQGVQFAGVYGGLSLGVPAALASLVVLGLTPVVTTAIAVASGMERPAGRVWAALGCGVAGVALSVAPELGDARVGAGIGLTVVGMLGLAGGTVLQKRWGSGADARVAVAVQSVVAGIAILPVAAIAGQLHAHASLKLGWTAAYLALPLSLGATTLMAVLLRRHAASTMSALLLLVPGVTAILSLVLLGDALSPVSLAGMAITTAAVLVVVRAARSAPRVAQPGSLLASTSTISIDGSTARRSGALAISAAATLPDRCA